MKVAELRSALQDRGLDTKGTKPVLVARLQEALDAEKPEEPVKTEEEAEAAANGDAAEPMDEDKKEEVKVQYFFSIHVNSICLVGKTYLD